jgi:hypothetical protein
MASYALKNLIAFDQQLNTLLGGDPDETISARAWRGRLSKRRWALAVRVIDALFSRWGPDHCRLAFEAEQKRQQLPREYRWAG